MRPLRSLHMCTVATVAELPSVRVLCASLRRHHAEADITVLLLDASAAPQFEAEEVRVVSPDGLGMSEQLVARLQMACTASEFAAALTPRLVRLLIEQGAPAVIALSPQTEVFAPLDDVLRLAGEHGVVLVPRLDTPVPDDGLEPTEADLRAAGTFASELVGVGAEATVFLDWWCHRQQRIAFSSGGFATAGPWTAEAPALFPVHVLRDQAYGVSAWSLHARELKATEGKIDVSGKPLRTFDFSGYAPDVPQVLSTTFERPRVRLSDSPTLTRLCDERGARLRNAGYTANLAEYGYASLADGKEIDARMRRMYVDALRDASEPGEHEPPSPFGPEGGEAFAAWVKEPVAPPDHPRLSRYLARVRDEAPSLQAFFPSLEGEGAEQYVGLLSTPGWLDAPEWVQPTEAEVLELIKYRWGARPTGSRPRGVNLVGYVTAVLGIGEVGRLFAVMLDAEGVPKVVVADDETSSDQSISFDTSFASDAPYDMNLLCVNADHTVHLARQLGPEFFGGRRTVGVWFWEVEDFPPAREAFDLVDEIWVASDFVLEAIAPVSPKPVRKFPLPVVVPSRPAGVTRAQLGLPDDRFVFLFVYDFLSTAERKNPIGLIDAYTRAFEPDDGVVLVLKSINGEKRIPQLERVKRAAAGRPDVIVLDGYLPQDLHHALVAECDAYVSLHRSEGFGLDMAKAMGLGKPVIATRYSGNLEFMDDTTSYLVDFDLGPVGPGNEPYPPDSRWARPRVDHAAALMRRVVERPDEARERGRRAAARIRSDFSLDTHRGALMQMLDEARARRTPEGSWRTGFMEGWRINRDRVEDLPYGGLDWLPDGTPVDEHIRRLLTSHEEGAGAPDPEADGRRFFAWLNEPVFPPGSPVVSRYLYRRWRDRPDLQSHFPNLDTAPGSYLEWLIEHGHADTDVPYQLLPTHDDVQRLTRYRERQERRERVARVLRSAGQRAARRVNRR